MGLFEALDSAIGGIAINQARTSLLSQNVAQADIPGYIKKTLTVNTNKGFTLSSQPSYEIKRYVDSFLQYQLLSQSSDQGRLQAIYDSLKIFDQLLAEPGGDHNLDTVYSNFLASLNSLSANPQSKELLDDFIHKARILTNNINRLAENINELQKQAVSDAYNSVEQANTLLKEIAEYNNKIASSRNQDSRLKVGLQDNLDRKITELATLINIKTEKQSDGSIKVYLSEGILLAYKTSSYLEFASPERTSLAGEHFSSTQLDSLILKHKGYEHDVISDRLLHSGKIAGYIELHDNILTNALDDLDSFAASIALSASRQKEAGTQVLNGFSIDASALNNGDIVTLRIRNQDNSISEISFIQTNEIPPQNSAIALLGDNIHAVDFSQDIATTIAQISNLLGSDYLVEESLEGNLQISSISASFTIEDLSSYKSVSSFSQSFEAIPFFTDSSNIIFSGSIDGLPQIHGFSQRIKVNDELIFNPEKLVTGSNGEIIDSTAVFSLYEKFQESYTFTQSLGSNKSFKMSPGGYLQNFISFYARKIGDSQIEYQAQDNLLNQIKNQFHQEHGVNIEEELANLIVLQHSFAANARIITTISKMLDELLKI